VLPRFSIANHLFKLQASSGDVDETVIARVASSHFAKVPKPQPPGADGELGCLDRGVPLEAQGLPKGDKRALLEAAMQSQDRDSEAAVAAAIAGLVCFGARQQPMSQASVQEHLMRLLSM